jgi:hypothetical protein
MHIHTLNRSVLALLWVWPAFLPAQTAADLKQILDRIERLEKQNQTLTEEVRELRARLGEPGAPAQPEERLAIQERRVEEMAEVKVESANRFPIRVTGMALFNSFWNSAGGVYGGTRADYPVTAPPNGITNAGATVRQSIVGLDFRGPQTLWGGHVRGSLNMDFYGGSGSSLDSLFRVRTASMELDWKTRSIMVGQEKPIIAPRDPSSLAQVGVSPLTGAGNLWLWQPQVRFEQRVTFGEQTKMRAQIGVYQTNERGAMLPANYEPSLESARPALQGRFELSHSIGDGRRVEIAPGFHTSSTHVAYTSVPSNLFSVDWFANPWVKLEFTGTFFSGQNLANLGTGLRQGFTVLNPGSVKVTL